MDTIRLALKERIDLFQSYMNRELERVDLVADILGNNPVVLAALEQNSQSTEKANSLLKTTNDKLNTSAVYLLNRSGLTIAASNAHEAVSFVGKNYAFRPYFIDAVTTGTGTFLAYGVTSGKLGYYVSRAIYDNKELKGVLVIKVKLDHIRNLIKDFAGEFLLADQNGIIFLSSEANFELKSLQNITAQARLYITRTKQYPIAQIERLNYHTGSNRSQSNDLIHIAEKEYLREAANLKKLKWTLWLLGDVQPVFNHALRNSLIFSTSSLIIILCLLILQKRRRDLKRFQTIVDNLPSGVTLFNENLQMSLCNEKAKQVLDLPDSLFKNGMPSFQALARFNAERGEYGEGDPDKLARDAIEKVYQREHHIFERTRPDGTVLEIRGHWMEDKGFVTTYTDITERKKVEEESRRNTAYLQALLQHLDQGVTVTDEKLDIIFWNKAFFELLEFPKEIMKPKMKYEDLLRYNAQRGEYGPGDPEQHVQSRILTALKFQPHHFERTRPDGHTLEVTGKPLLVDGETLGFISTYVDITEHKRMAERLRKLANTDDLSGLHNRRFFNSLLTREIKRCQRNGQPLSLLMMDLDHFKLINDRFGHACGDLVLKEFAKSCSEVLRDIDIFGRMGGEEFAIFLPDTDRTGAQTLAERLRQTTEDIELQSENGEKITITVSIGISFYDSADKNDTQDDLINRADKALYKAKANGRNRVC